LEEGREEVRPVGKYLTDLVRYVNRKNAPSKKTSGTGVVSDCAMSIIATVYGVFL
jgi:hypothetical protein